MTENYFAQPLVRSKDGRRISQESSWVASGSSLPSVVVTSSVMDNTRHLNNLTYRIVNEYEEWSEERLHILDHYLNGNIVDLSSCVEVYSNFQIPMEICP